MHGYTITAMHDMMSTPPPPPPLDIGNLLTYQFGRVPFSQMPCYNPGGRYLVKLFAAGRWRGVEVDDSIPVDAARSPVSPASSEGLEGFSSRLR